MNSHEELIEEAESWVAHTKPSVVGAILRDLISALESVHAERDAATEELAKIKPLFENLSREYPNECNKRVKAEAERDAALEAIERARAIHERDRVLRDYCSECSDFGSDQFPPGQMVEWPCSTVQALDGAPEPEAEAERSEAFGGARK